MLGWQQGERLKILKDAFDKGWFVAESIDGQQGMVPETHLEFEGRSPSKASVAPAPASPEQTKDKPRLARSLYPYKGMHGDELSFQV